MVVMVGGRNQLPHRAYLQTHFLICCSQRTPSGPCLESFHRTVRAWLPLEGIYERVPDSSHRHFITRSQKQSHHPPIAYLQEAAQQVPPISQGKELERDMPLNRHPLRSHNNKRDANFKAIFSSASLCPMSKCSLVLNILPS